MFSSKARDVILCCTQTKWYGVFLLPRLCWIQAASQHSPDSAVLRKACVSFCVLTCNMWCCVLELYAPDPGPCVCAVSLCVFSVLCHFGRGLKHNLFLGVLVVPQDHHLAWTEQSEIIFEFHPNSTPTKSPVILEQLLIDPNAGTLQNKAPPQELGAVQVLPEAHNGDTSFVWGESSSVSSPVAWCSAGFTWSP